MKGPAISSSLQWRGPFCLDDSDEMVKDMEVRAGKRTARQAERHGRLIELVMANGSSTIEDLASALNVSVMTIHRDLDELEQEGMLRKARGFATALPSSTVESNDKFRREQQRDEKLELSKAALSLIQPGQTVLLDDSTTLIPLLEFLPTRTPLTLVSNSHTVIDATAGVEGISLVAIGGEYHSWCNAFMGQITTDVIDSLQVDLLIMSTSAIINGACYHQRQDTVSTKRAMIRAAAQKVLLVDHTKFERRALHRLCPLTDFDQVIVDSRTPQERIDEMLRQNIDVIVAPASRGRLRDIGSAAHSTEEPLKTAPTG